MTKAYNIGAGDAARGAAHATAEQFARMGYSEQERKDYSRGYSQKLDAMMRHVTRRVGG